MKHFIVEPKHVIAATLFAVLVYVGSKKVWLPKSRIIMSVATTGMLHILIPEWICQREKLK